MIAVPHIWDKLADDIWDKLVNILASHQLEPSQLTSDEFQNICDLLLEGEEIEDIIADVKQRIHDEYLLILEKL